MNNFVVLFLRLLIALPFLFVSYAQAGGNHGGGAPKKPRQVAAAVSLTSLEESANDRAIKGDFLGASFIDGYQVSVKIADVKDSIPDGGSHNVLVKIKLGDAVQRNAVVKATVVFPDDGTKTKTFLELGDWYLAGYNLNKKGKYAIAVSFTNKGDHEHTVNFVYP